MEERKLLKLKDDLNEEEEENLISLEKMIAEACEEINRSKVIENFKDIDGGDDNLSHQGVWKAKQKYFPKIKPNLPVGKKNLKKQMITNPEELKQLYLDTFKYRLRQRPVKPGFENILDLQEELFKLRLESAKKKKTAPWNMKDLDLALRSLKRGKCRDPDGLLREIFKEGVIGEDLKSSLLVMLNKIKMTGYFPSFMKVTNISAIYKGKGEVTDLESDRGIFLVSIFRTILMTLIYKEKYDVIELSMSDSNIGARKQKNIRNHIFIVNCIIQDVLSKKSKEPIDIMVLDYKQMFDSECLFECMNDLFEAGVDDDMFALVYEANRENFVAVNTPHGISKRETVKEIVMQGDVLAPLISSLQVDTIGKECLEEEKHLFHYKDLVPIPPLGLVDDLFTISKCGLETEKLNRFINNKTALKRLQFGTSKCVKLHVGRQCNPSLCKDLYVDSWNLEVVTDPETGKYFQKESFDGPVKMATKTEQKYLGDIISIDGKQTKNVQARKNKALGTITQIIQILETVFFGKYHFEVAMILRSSLLLSSLLLNSEAWVNLSDKDIRSLEQTDEHLLGKILDSESRTSNAFKYLELGIYPIRFEIMKRKIIYLQYILQQDKDSMIYKVFKATLENPLKNDFVRTCQKYLEKLNIKSSFEEIERMSKLTFKKLVKEKTKKAAFIYLIEEKKKQSKITDVKYERLEMQEYLMEGNKNTKLSKLIFKARGRTLAIKTHKKWKFDDNICVGCEDKMETENEFLTCRGLGDVENVSYEMVFGESVEDMIKLAKVIRQRLKAREKILDGPS